MKLLIVTQTVDADDPVLGFFCAWIAEFAKHFERVEVICLREGKYDLPENVRVHSLGKDRGRPLLGSFAYAMRFKRLVWRLRSEYGAVFVHMNPEYVVIGGLLWRMLGKRITLWYTHKNIDLKLRIATALSDVVFTASPESFRLSTGKLHVMGHGIDAGRFSCPTRASEGGIVRAVSIGRITESKRLEELVDALAALRENGIDASLDFVGAPVTGRDVEYEKSLRTRIESSPAARYIRLLGPKTQGELPALLCSYGLFLHASSGTGSLDKAPLEAMSCGVPVVSTSEAFRDILEPYGLYAAAKGETLAGCAERFVRQDFAKRAETARLLREEIVRKHSLAALIGRLSALITAPSGRAA